MTADLVSRYRGIVCDLDGVVYRARPAVPHAVEALERARAAGVRVVYATNNASRPPQHVADHLRGLGLGAQTRDVVTSAQAGARTLARRLPPGALVLAVGGEGVVLALEAEGLRAVRSAEAMRMPAQSPVQAVLQGYGKDVSWRDLAEAAVAVNHGAQWVATNTDLTIPTDRGIAPGNGTLVGAVRAAVATDPDVVGKPHTPLYELAADVLGTDPVDTLAIGDRLDTDILGAVRTGMDGLYVMTGVSRPADVAVLPADERPHYVAVDLRALHVPYVPAQTGEVAEGARATCGEADVTCRAAGFVLHGGGSPDERLRALVTACWAAADTAAVTLGRLEACEWSRAQDWIETGS